MTTTLIVDDELDMRTLVRTIIEIANEGLSVVGEAADGDEALSLWRSLNPPPVPDVVILDNRMPGITGLELARLILSEMPEQAVILYSAFLDEAIRAEALRVGIAACVSKTDIRTLPDVIKKVLQGRAA